MNQIIPRKNFLKFTFLGSVFIFFFILYFDYFKYDPLLGRDDNLLVTPLINIDSFGNYLDKIWRNEILDVQPLRDLSFWMNIKIKHWFNVSTFHFFNFIIFCILVTLVFNLFQVLFENNHFPYLFSLVFAVHPILVSAIGWVSARKHSLATMFILIAIINFLKKKSVNYVTVVSYVLSLCSHQIYFLFPLWALVYSKIKKYIINRKILFLLMFLGFAIVCIGFYKTFVINSAGIVYSEKESLFANLSKYVLSLGRSFTLVFFPKSIAAAYYQGSYWNLVGIPILVLFIFGALRPRDSRRDIMLWLLLAFLSFAPTIIAFVNDSYLYIYLVSILICIAHMIQSVKKLKYIYALQFFLSVYVLLFSFKTIDASGIWMSNARLWQYSYLNEKSPYNAIILSSHIKNQHTVLELLVWAAEHYDFSRNLLLAEYFTTKIYLSRVISRNEKMRILKKFYHNLLIYEVYISLLLFEGDIDEAKAGFQFLRDSRQIWESDSNNPFYFEKIIKQNLKDICLKDSRKKHFCKELGFETGVKNS